MNATVLCDNHAGRRVTAKHGFSLLLETSGGNILFDTGPDKTFAANAHASGFELFGVNFIVISHGHYDHTGGLSKAVQAAPEARVIVHAGTAEPKFHISGAEKRPIGMPETALRALELVRQEQRLTVLDSDKMTLCSGVTVFAAGGVPDIPHEWPFYRQAPDGTVQPDDFADELVLLLEYDGGASVISGCSHCGVRTIIDRAEQITDRPVRRFIGGTHMSGASPDEFDELCDYLRDRNIELLVGHCTGINGAMELARRLPPGQVAPFHTGMSFSIG